LVFFTLNSMLEISFECVFREELVLCKIQKHENHARNKSNKPQCGKREKRHSINKPAIQWNPIDDDSGSYVQPNKKRARTKR
jgi:hypothetical protein